MRLSSLDKRRKVQKPINFPFAFLTGSQFLNDNNIKIFHYENQIAINSEFKGPSSTERNSFHTDMKTPPFSRISHSDCNAEQCELFRTKTNSRKAYRLTVGL